MTDSTLETVLWETPANFATSCMVGMFEALSRPRFLVIPYSQQSYITHAVAEENLLLSQVLKCDFPLLNQPVDRFVNRFK